MCKLKESSGVQVRCRQADLQLVVDAVDPARKAYEAKVKGAKAPTVAVSQESFLPPPPTPGYAGETCTGGVVLASADGKIVLSNTLDARLAIAQEQNLPV